MIMNSLSSIFPKNLWVKPRPGSNFKIRLFCFPYSGASASQYFPWLNLIRSDVEILPVELPGHGSRLSEPARVNLEDLVSDAADGLLPFLDRPFAFFGHSLGALIGFELARLLHDRYHQMPVHLFVSGHPAPQLPDPATHIHHLPEPGFVEKLREMNGMDESILAHPELRELLIPVLRADFQACETYHFLPGEPLSCPLTAMGGLQDAYVSRGDMQAWSIHTRGPFKLRMIPGDHFFLNTARWMVVQAVAQDLLAVPAPV